MITYLLAATTIFLLFIIISFVYIVWCGCFGLQKNSKLIIDSLFYITIFNAIVTVIVAIMTVTQ